VGPKAGLDRCGKSRTPTAIRSPDRPVKSKSLYLLSYPTNNVTFQNFINTFCEIKVLPFNNEAQSTSHKAQMSVIFPLYSRKYFGQIPISLNLHIKLTYKYFCLVSQSIEFRDNHKLTFKCIPFQNYMTFYQVLTDGPERTASDKPKLSCSY
jgi:hypothetical protein